MAVPAFALALLPACLFAQPGRVPLPGHIPRAALTANDLGVKDPAAVEHASVVLKASDRQEVELERLLSAQQDPSSPEHNRWLTPEQYAERFGVSQTDVDQVAAWLRSQHLHVDSIARGRNRIAFSGTVGDLEGAFATSIHSFDLNGEMHFANVQSPSVPVALSPLIRSVHGLHDFRLRPPERPLVQTQPHYNGSGGVNHYLAPDDLALIYNIRPLYKTGIDGTNQKVVVVGQTQLPLNDIRQFRSSFGLTAIDPEVKLVPGTRDPGVTDGDLIEADLDVEWAGAIARNASIQYVYSYDVIDAVQYAIDQNLAPVLSMSYGLCEADTGLADMDAMRVFAKQANVQGMTWVTASGDSGANDCYASNPRGAGALGVDGPASIPEVTGVGGTTFSEGSGSFWAPANDANRASALSYIPEVVWNDGGTAGAPASGGGGASMFYKRPLWQTGPGVASDDVRSVPDISLSASAAHDGYLVYSSGSLQVVGGTSAGAPVFAGAMALLNQYVVANGLQSSAGLGNINPRLYSLAQSVPGAFHDVTGGDNIVTACASRARSCLTQPIGFKAGVGYDQATGLGSVDVFNLISNWRAGGSTPNTSLGPPVIGGVTNAASYTQAFAPGMIASVFGSQLAGAVGFASAIPLPLTLLGVNATVNGIAAPLYYVSSGQVNLQIPASVPAGSMATLAISNGSQSASVSLLIAAAAPGIFAFPAGFHASRGETIAMYMTGEGNALPAVAVGGVNAGIVYSGIPSWSVGVRQINFTVPVNAPLGAQPVVVTANGVASAGAGITITQ